MPRAYVSTAPEAGETLGIVANVLLNLGSPVLVRGR